MEEEETIKDYMKKDGEGEGAYLKQSVSYVGVGVVGI